MTKSQLIRFAAGNPQEPFSSVQRLIADKVDVYIGASKMAMHFFKISLHKDVWIVAGTEESGVTFEHWNREAKQWNIISPGPHGITRGPSILVPHTSLGSRRLSVLEGEKHIVWYAGPRPGEMVDFSMYFIKPGIFPHWLSSHSVLSELGLVNGSRVTLLASTRPAPADLMTTVDNLISDAKVQMKDPSKFHTSSHLLMTQSPDELAIPMIIDMPVAVIQEPSQKLHTLWRYAPKGTCPELPFPFPKDIVKPGTAKAFTLLQVGITDKIRRGLVSCGLRSENYRLSHYNK